MNVSALGRAGIFLLGVATVACSRADAAPERGSVEDRLTKLESRQEKLVAELASLRARVGGPTRAEPVLPLPESPIAIAGLPSLGASNRWVLIEFSDFQCPFCRKYFTETFPQIERDYVRTGKIRYVFHHMPIQESHPEAVGGAEAAVCAQRQGKFWEFHRRLFERPHGLTTDRLAADAKAVGLDVKAYGTCMASVAKETVRQQIAASMVLRIPGTPAFMIGELQEDGSVQVRKRIQGAQSYQTFRSLLDQLITGT